MRPRPPNAVAACTYVSLLPTPHFTRGWGTLRRAELVNDLLGDFTLRAKFGVNQHIGLAVKRPPNFEKLRNLRHRIRTVQERPMRLAFDALPNFFG